MSDDRDLVRREAREAAIEEAAKVADGAVALVKASPDLEFITPKQFAADLAADVADGIRALAAKPGSELEELLGRPAETEKD